MHNFNVIDGLNSDEAKAYLGAAYQDFLDEIELVQGASHTFDQQDFNSATLSPVYFGTALGNFGVNQMLLTVLWIWLRHRNHGRPSREVLPEESKFSGFVFKIQANMDPNHRDRIAFLRICSGTYRQGMKMRHLRLGKDIKSSRRGNVYGGRPCTNRASLCR